MECNARINIEPAGGILAAGVSESFSVRYAPTINNLPAGVHETPITLTPANVSLPPIRITSRLVVQGDSSALVLLPDEGQLKQISLPLPDAEALFTFQITNEGSQPGNWAADLSQPWLELIPASGTLAPSETRTIEVRPSANADRLELGIHEAELTLTDRSNTASTTSVRFLQVEVQPDHPLQLTAKFENGSFVVKLAGPANTRFVIEESTDLDSWTQISVVQTSNLGTTFYRPESDQDQPARFVRFIPATSP
jgi:hypothetical protein